MIKAWISHESGLPHLGDLPREVTVEVYPGSGEYPSDPATVDFWVPPLLVQGLGTAPLREMSGLKVVQLMSAGAEVWIPIVPEQITLCDGQGVHTAATSEWALGAMIASLRGFDRFARAQQRREWDTAVTDSLDGKRVLIVGAGDIGSAIARKVAVCDAEPVLVARRARDGVHAMDELPSLLPDADVVVLIVPLTPDTRGMVADSFLAEMRDGALLVNAARGPVVDTAALVEHTRTGRLRAALDVTDPEPLPADNPLWTFPNVLITPHVGGAVPGLIDKAYSLAGRQLRRFVADERLHNIVTDGY